MKKSSLSIVREENRVVIKKKPDAGRCVEFAIIFAAGVSFPIVFEELRSSTLFWVFYVICMWVNVAAFLSVFLGKIVVDPDAKEICLYNLCKETHRFDEIKELKPLFDEGDPEGPDTYKVRFIFKDGKRSELETASREQAEELIELLHSVIFPCEQVL